MGKPGMKSSDPHLITRYVLYTAQYVRNRSPYPAIFSSTLWPEICVFSILAEFGLDLGVRFPRSEKFLIKI